MLRLGVLAGLSRASSSLRHLPAVVTVTSPLLPCAEPVKVTPELQESLGRGETRRLGNVVVHRRGDMLRLERAQEPGNIQSEWDAGMGSTPDYAGTMAEMARRALLAQAPPRGAGHSAVGGRVLMLGLGGGTIAGQLLLAGATPDGSFDPLLRVTAIEADYDVARAASRYFVPTMFERSAGAASLERRLRILHADARGVVEGTTASLSAEDAGPYDVIIEDFAYEEPGRLGAPFWRGLRESLAAPGCTVLINTLYSSHAEMDVLANDLREAGWRDVRRKVDRGLQAPPGQTRQSYALEDWRPNDNMIFAANCT